MTESLKSSLALVTRRRLELLLKAMHEVSLPEELRLLRAVQALELIGTAEAQTLLQSLAKGVAAARQTREAKESLERLARRAALEKPPADQGQ